MTAAMNRLTREQTVYVLKGIGVVGLFLLLLGVLAYPEYQRGVKLQQRINSTRYAILEQEMFAPLHARLQKDLSDTLPDNLPLVEPGPLAKGGMNVLPARVADLAAEAGYEALEVTVDPGSLSRRPDHILVRVVVSGPSARFRDFFLSFSSLAFVTHLEKMEMRAVPDGLEVMLQAWVLLGGDAHAKED